MSLQDTVFKLLEKSIDNISKDSDSEFPDEEFGTLFKDTFKGILKQTNEFSKMNTNEMKKRLEELETENKTLKQRVVDLEKQLQSKLLTEIDLD
jgi:gas vesicle protein